MEQETTKSSFNMDFIMALVLGVATLFGATSAYFSSLHGGNCITNYNKAIMKMSESNTTYLESLSNLSTMEITDLKEDFLMVQYEKAQASENQDDEDYYVSKFSEELRKIYESETGAAEDSAVAEYERVQDEKREELDALLDDSDKMYDESNAMFKQGQIDNGNGDSFTFATVIFTVSMFFGGISLATTGGNKIKMIFSLMSIAVLVYSIIKFFTIPFPF